MITGAVHLPLNRAIGEVTLDAPAPELAAARARFERRWVRWNVVRTLTSTGALVCLAVALLRLD
ncbi:anthrone oxygenase family protein [Nocardioides caldifontis]|uniref:anthrone oxygenase family protein n=1 Tax=Nocardioides caldifontis TaxID=2588938 RepID=UPI00193A2991|nr:anthrone oxygenase family protein [Nocardioides caldifontis]